jgi:preprotein translocase subunit SecA
MPTVREDSNDVVFRVADGKWNAVITEIERMHATGRPVLVGTTSVESSELVSEKLSLAKIPHEVRL